MSKVMVTISGGSRPTLAEVKQAFALSDAEIDPDYGVIEVDDENHVYSILVEEQAAAKISGHGWSTEGPFSNPRIEPFGPPQA